MTRRRARLVFEPLLDWPHPQVRHEQSTFSARWAGETGTRDLLLKEADQLGATLVVVELDLRREDLRQDGEIRANARLHSGKVRVSLDTKHGPMRFACDRYHAGTLSWQANARAIALTMEALRTVERYGAVHTAEQYQGFLAIEATAPEGFGSVDEALRWLARVTGLSAEETPLPTLYRAAVKRLHPDAGGDPADWARLDYARQILEDQGVWRP
jgi:hypothetical protein